MSDVSERSGEPVKPYGGMAIRNFRRTVSFECGEVVLYESGLAPRHPPIYVNDFKASVGCTTVTRDAWEHLDAKFRERWKKVPARTIEAEPVREILPGTLPTEVQHGVAAEKPNVWYHNPRSVELIVAIAIGIAIIAMGLFGLSQGW